MVRANQNTQSMSMLLHHSHESQRHLDTFPMITVPLITPHVQRIRSSARYSQLVLGGFLGVLVSLDAVDLAEHDVLEAVSPRAFSLLRVPVPTVREPVLPQRGGQHQPELVPCNTTTPRQLLVILKHTP